MINNLKDKIVGKKMMCDDNSKSSANLEDSKTLYIVEDDPDLQNLYSIYFQKNGWRIIDQAENGIDAIERYKSLCYHSHPKIVLIDLNLPG